MREVWNEIPYLCHYSKDFGVSIDRIDGILSGSVFLSSALINIPRYFTSFSFKIYLFLFSLRFFSVMICNTYHIRDLSVKTVSSA